MCDGGLGKFGLAAVVEMDREQNGPNIISLSLVLSANWCVERQVLNKISSLTWDNILQLP